MIMSIKPICKLTLDLGKYDTSDNFRECATGIHNVSASSRSN